MSSVGVPDVAVAAVPACDTASSNGDAEIVRGKARTRKRTAGADVGQLLRGAYRQTVEEAIPDDLLDLLNRLE
ncbi:MAG TPA: NepR family anti-sigma factor [Sphingobium sp.]|nr:NepR family anti-sigma factor [Sphingobium sp.]